MKATEELFKKPLRPGLRKLKIKLKIKLKLKGGAYASGWSAWALKLPMYLCLRRFTPPVQALLQTHSFGHRQAKTHEELALRLHFISPHVKKVVMRLRSLATDHIR